MNKPSYSTDNPEEMVDSLNTVLDTGILLGSNLNGQIIENIKLPVGENVAISHNLKMVPKYRIILRQQGGLVITDGDLAWDDKKIYLKSVSNIGSGSFTQNISAPSYAFPSPVHVSNTIISAASLNSSFVDGASIDSEAIVTIILMRG